MAGPLATITGAGTGIISFLSPYSLMTSAISRDILSWFMAKK